jgi:cyanophycinase
MRLPIAALFLAFFLALFAACGPAPKPTLILIGGGLERDNAAVYARLLERAGDPPRVLIATLASLDESAALASAATAFRAFAPTLTPTHASRETPPADAVALIDDATLVFFTGGDQKRIIDRYRPAGVDQHEAAALRRLLARGGTIAGTSAGLAMMSDPMFLEGSSDDALRDGPQIGPGLGLLSGVIVDSHFVERARVGRLAAALNTAKVRVGVGLAENAAAEVDLTTLRLTALSDAPTVVLDASRVTRAEGSLRGLRTRTLHRGDILDLALIPPIFQQPRVDRARAVPTAGILADPRPTHRHTILASTLSDGWLAVEIEWE